MAMGAGGRAGWADAASPVNVRTCRFACNFREKAARARTRLRGLYLNAPDGAMVPLGELTKVREETIDKNIYPAKINAKWFTLSRT